MNTHVPAIVARSASRLSPAPMWQDQTTSHTRRRRDQGLLLSAAARVFLVTMLLRNSKVVGCLVNEAPPVMAIAWGS